MVMALDYRDQFGGVWARDGAASEQADRGALTAPLGVSPLSLRGWLRAKASVLLGWARS